MRGPRFWRPSTASPRPRNPGRCHGFTAIELALVIAATSIVVALGVSTYRTYSVRAQISTSVEEAIVAQRLVVAAFEEAGLLPLDAAAAGIDDSARDLLVGIYIDGLRVSNGRIDLRFGMRADPAIAGKTLSLTPFETVEKEVVWICGNESPGVGLEPLGFAGGAPQPVQTRTSIEDRYLPRSCR